MHKAPIIHIHSTKQVFSQFEIGHTRAFLSLNSWSSFNHTKPFRERKVTLKETLMNSLDLLYPDLVAVLAEEFGGLVHVEPITAKKDYFVFNLPKYFQHLLLVCQLQEGFWYHRNNTFFVASCSLFELTVKFTLVNKQTWGEFQRIGILIWSQLLIIRISFDLNLIGWSKI